MSHSSNRSSTRDHHVYRKANRKRTMNSSLTCNVLKLCFVFESISAKSIPRRFDLNQRSTDECHCLARRETPKFLVFCSKLQKWMFFRPLLIISTWLPMIVDPFVRCEECEMKSLKIHLMINTTIKLFKGWSFSLRGQQKRSSIQISRWRLPWSGDQFARLFSNALNRSIANVINFNVVQRKITMPCEKSTRLSNREKET